jgi:hypothetical protein
VETVAEIAVVDGPAVVVVDGPVVAEIAVATEAIAIGADAVRAGSLTFQRFTNFSCHSERSEESLLLPCILGE